MKNKLIWLALALAPAACAGDILGGEGDLAEIREPLTLTLTKHAEAKRLRVVTFNTHLLPPLAYDELGVALPPNWDGYGDAKDKANALADAILARASDYDVIVLNEVFDDDEQDTLAERLAPEFPHWVVHIDGLVRNPLGEDSGLAVFSRHRFEALDQGNTFGDRWSAESSAGPIGCNGLFPLDCPSWFAFRPYEDCESDDCEAHKGAGLVRVVAGDHKYNVAFTHMQADYPGKGALFPGTRVAQLADIRRLLFDYVPVALDGAREDVVVAGDLNIEGWPGSPLGTAEYAGGIFAHLDGLPFYDAWRTTSPDDQGLTHRFPAAEVGRLDYLLVYGLGYHLPGQPGIDPLAFLFGEHDRQCPQHAHLALADQPSDHVGVALEFGPRGAACRPDLAVKPAFPPGGAFVDVVHLDQPGQVKWYRVDEPGTFTVGFLKAAHPRGDVDAEVYLATDLSRPISAINGEPVKKIDAAAACDPHWELPSCRFVGETFFPGNRPFYVKVSAPTGLFTGDVPVLIQKHDCSTEDMKCWLRPGDAPRVETGDPSQHTFFYAFRTHAAIDGAAQSFTVEAKTDGPDPIFVTLSSQNRGVLQPEEKHLDWKRDDSETAEDDYLLRIRRVSFQVHRIAWRTDLTFLHGGSAYCYDETEGDALGSDETLVQVGTLAGATHFERFWPEVNAPRRLPFGDMPSMAVVGPARITIAELSSETLTHDLDEWDDRVDLTIPGLDPFVAEHRDQLIDTPLYDYDDGEIDWGDAYGGYQLTFHQSHDPGNGQP